MSMNDIEERAQRYADTVVARGVLREIAKAAYKAGAMDQQDAEQEKLTDDSEPEVKKKKVFIKG